MRAKRKGSGTGIQVNPEGKSLKGVEYCADREVPPPAEDFLPHGISFKSTDWASCWNQFGIPKFPDCLRLPDEANLIKVLPWGFPLAPIPPQPKENILLASEVINWCVGGYCSELRFVGIAQRNENGVITQTQVNVTPGTGLLISIPGGTWATYVVGTGQDGNKIKSIAYGPDVFYAVEGEIRLDN